MMKLTQAMKRKNFGRYFLVGVLITGNTVVADDVKLATGQPASADLVRRGSLESLPLASATEAAFAATVTTNQLPLSAEGANPSPLPPLSPDVTELRFSEFFRSPIGPRGLEFTDKLRSLEGRRIRILGYMVRQTKPGERCFLLSPVPLTLNEIEYGHADDLPATALHVFATDDAPAHPPYTPGLLLLTGKLSLGNRLEADGRTSTVRLFLDPPTSEQKQATEQAVAAAKKMKPAGHDDHVGHGHGD
jgi:hypothetical protein